MNGRLHLAMLVTFLILGILLSAVFWVAVSIAGIKGTNLVIMSFAFVGLMTAVQWYLGPVIIKSMSRMRESGDEGINGMVYGLADAAGIPRPKVYVVDDPAPNAFAFGRTQSSSNIALHTGLLQRLDKNEVRAVIAHEIGHIRNRDVIVMTLASALPVMLYYIIYFGMIFAPRNNDEAPNYWGAWLGGMAAQFVATLLVLYLSRVREYSADAHSARATQSPESLASALAKISYTYANSGPVPVPSGMGAFYIANPMLEAEMKKEKQSGGLSEIFMTHPPTWKRIRALRA